MSAHSGIPLIFSEEVSDVLASGRPVVALESNVITHGLPYPDNAATAQKWRKPSEPGVRYRRRSVSRTVPSGSA